MITVTYTSSGYDPAKVVTRYVRRDPIGKHYLWCEVGADRRYNLRQGRCEASDLPAGVKDKADVQRSELYGAVEWPFSFKYD